MKQILLLEDDLALAHGIALALKAAGQVLPCPDLAAARQALQAQAFDLLLLDMNLPDGSGLDLCREVRRTASVPIIFLTARDAEYDEVAGLEAGADDYIVKPFSLPSCVPAWMPRCAGPGGRLPARSSVLGTYNSISTSRSLRAQAPRSRSAAPNSGCCGCSSAMPAAHSPVPCSWRAYGTAASTSTKTPYRWPSAACGKN